MKISQDQKEWINSLLIYKAENSEQRSNIQVAARHLSESSKDPENSYWLLVYHFLDPKNKKDLEKALRDVDPLQMIDNNADFEKSKKKKRSGGKRTRK